MSAKELPSPELLRQLLRYEPETGKLFWLPRGQPNSVAIGEIKRWNGRYAGKPAMTIRTKSGHLRGDINGVKFYAHRVAWAIHYGAWPDDEIDHINGVADDNRIDNLRAADKSVNMRNQRLKKTNKSGAHGVFWSKHINRWKASIYADGRSIHLGCFVDFADAFSARKEAEKKHGYHPNHGRT